MMDETNQKLVKLMRKHGLTRSKAAALAMVTDSAFDRYLAPPERDGEPNPQYRTMPPHRLHLIEIHLEHPQSFSDEEREERLKATEEMLKKPPRYL
jgi:hypothetical protein